MKIIVDELPKYRAGETNCIFATEDDETYQDENYDYVNVLRCQICGRQCQLQSWEKKCGYLTIISFKEN